ncbi:TetR/AcrR family transcriptional regulator (plasmid) [Methylomonas sp. MS20]|uniref:TetR/AcrR family transcriptional regulator n=1 Tax=Methylomonas sp. MS20 TaxID=3418769 RepID=UPI003D00B7FF
MNTPPNPKRQAILAAAKRLFVAQGYSAVSMDAIAEAAPVSKPTLYNHFQGKQELFAAVIECQCQAFFDTLSSARMIPGATEAALRQIAMSFADLIYSTESLGLLRLIIAEHPSFPELSQQVHRRGIQPVFDRLTRFLVGLHEDDESIQIPDQERAAKLLLGMIQGNDHMRCLMGLRSPPDANEKKIIVDSAVNLFLRGHRRSGPKVEL